MKHLLTSVAVGLIGLSVATTVQAQSEPMTLDRYRELSNKVLEAETRCWDAADKSEAYKKQIYRDYRDARFEFVKELYGDEFSGSKEGWSYAIKDSGAIINPEFKRKYQDDGFINNELMDCPPETRKEREAQRLESRKLEDRDEQHTLTRHFFPDREWAATASVSREIRDIPQSGYGVRILPNTEEYAGLSADKVTGTRLSVTLENNAGEGFFSDVEFDFDYTWAGDGFSITTLDGTDNVGFVNHDFAPSGSTGVAIGNRGLDVNGETDFESLSARVKALYANLDVGENSVDAYAGFGARFEETEHRATVTTPSFSDISSSSIQKVNEKLFFATTGLETNWFVTKKFEIHIESGINFGFLNSDLDSQQQNICGLCAATDQNFAVAIEDDDSKFFFGAHADAGATYKIGDRFGIGANAGLFWRDKVGFALNPETGDDLFIRNTPTELAFEEMFGVHFGVHAQTWW